MTESDFALAIRVTAATRLAVERAAADVGMSAPRFIEHALARWLADARFIDNMETHHDDVCG